jgi:conjugative relaxase-like TrwC/TraI family protein
MPSTGQRAVIFTWYGWQCSVHISIVTMLTISKPISAGQAQTYHREEFSNAKENYYTVGDQVRGEWQGRLAAHWGLTGEVEEAHYARLSEGQHPTTGEQLVRHQTRREYLNRDGGRVRTMEHRAGWDATFSAPKSVSLTALAGDDARIRAAHRESVTIALDEMERFVQARISGSLPPVTTGQWVVAKFEHDSSRPVGGYAAPQLHTHAVIFNLTETFDSLSHALQPQEIFRTQRYGTAVYRAELALRLRQLGYEIERGEHGSPEIKGYTKEYLEASSPRRQQIKEYLAEHSVAGAEAAEIAAHQTRGKKLHLTREEVLAQHQAMASRYGHQPQRIIELARERGVVETEERNSADLVQRAISTSKERNIEREAVVDERAILADALKHAMGQTHTAEVTAELEERIRRRELIEVTKPGRAARAFTTPEMQQYEFEVLRRMCDGQDRHEALALDDAQQLILSKHQHLREGQREAVREILGSHDQIIGLEGAAGTGKTTALAAVCEAARGAGYEVEGLAPTSRAAQNLAEAGMETKTLARHLTEGERSRSESRHLYVVDESSMASTRQMHEFLSGIRSGDRVLFVGDIRQHEAVDAGRPYAQLQEAGMRTARLDEIIRQKDEGLKRAVSNLANGNVEEAISTLRGQGRVHQIAEREDRIREIAREYARQPENTLVISPDNDSRLEITRHIHRAMQGIGSVSQDEQTVSVLVTRQDLTNEDRRWAQNYQPGDVLRYIKNSKKIGVAAREFVRVQTTDEKQNRITVERANGETITYDPCRVQGVTAYREAERAFAAGDRVQFTAPFHPEKIANRELGTIKEIDGQGNLKLRMDSGRELHFNLRQHPHLDYGYAVTSHSSQGETADRVLIHVDSEHAHKGLINHRMAYVSVSRARYDAQIFTNDAESLGRELSRDVSHSSALQQDQQQHSAEQASGMAQSAGVGSGR